jgi:N-acetylglucosamine kinase-like BadF-type ATPase
MDSRYEHAGMTTKPGQGINRKNHPFAFWTAPVIFRGEANNGMSSDRKIFLGVDIGATKTRALLVDNNGAVLGFGIAGPGNHESVGWDGLAAALQAALDKACKDADARTADILAAGFGIGGLDWDAQEPDTRRAIGKTGLSCPMHLENDTILGLVAGAPEGWGIAVVSGTGCNCWGWNRDRTRIGRVTGGGIMMGEGAGATELTAEAVKAVSRAWIRRSPATALSDVLLECTGARDLPDMFEGLMEDRYRLEPCAAPRIFDTAAKGDAAAKGLIDWAGTELGEMINAVARQLEFQGLEFDVVMIGSMFDAGPVLVDPMRRKVQSEAPRARFIRLACPPVVGAAILALERGGITVDGSIRTRLVRETIARM